MVTDHVSDLIHAKSVEVDLAYYENPAYHDTLFRAQEEAPWRPTSIVSGLMQLGQNGITFLGMAGLLLSFHWGAAVVICLASVPGVLVRVRYAGDLFRWQRTTTEMERRAWYFHEVLTNGTFAKEIRLFGLGHLFTGWFRDLRRQLREAKLKMQKRRSLFPRPITRGIDFSHVSFGYPGAARAVLKDVTLTMAPGKVVALVGENGSGKTTLIKLLCRFYDPILDGQARRLHLRSR